MLGRAEELDPTYGWASVSVQTETALRAGAFTTIAMLKGPDGLAFLSEQGCAYFAVDIEGRILRNRAEQ